MHVIPSIVVPCVCSPNYLDFHGVVKALPGTVCPLLLYKNDPQIYLIKLQHLANKNQVYWVRKVKKLSRIKYVYR